MLDLDIQLFADEENKEGEQVQPVVETPPETTTQPFKAFENEEEFNKFTQSISSKAKGELLKEIGYNSVSDIKSVVEKGNQFDDISNKYTEVESKYKGAIDEAEALRIDLITTKYNISDEFKDEFVTLTKAKVNDDTDINKAAQSVYEKLSKSFFNEGKKPSIKIGGDSSKITENEQEIMEKYRKL